MFKKRQNPLLIFFLFSLLLLGFIPSASPAEDEPLFLVAEIRTPASNALIWGDVPVYGRAGGSDFKEYYLEYGLGPHPSEWQTIIHSLQAQMSLEGTRTVPIELIQQVSGNLGLWQTGLSMDHPKDDRGHPNLEQGTYALRLRVIGHSGAVKEDVVQVEIGQVALNCQPNRIVSPDQKAQFYIREHSLQQPAKVFSLRSLAKSEIYIEGESYLRLISPLYQLLSEGAKFTLPASLRISVDQEWETHWPRLGIGYFNEENKSWEILESVLDEADQYLEAQIEHIPEQFAVFGVFEGPDIRSGYKVDRLFEQARSVSSLLVVNSFEEGVGRWKNKHGLRGADVQLAELGCATGWCIAIRNQSMKGNFAAVAYDEPFDAAQYSVIEFDYRLPEAVKVNLLVRAGNRWFDIGFADDPKLYWGVNMQPVGQVPAVKKDDNWHRAQINLFEMLKEHTEDFVVQEILFADWDVSGFKKLEYGNTPAKSVFYIDNFRIRSDRYFWQIGWADRSGDEFSTEENNGGGYTVGDDFLDFPPGLDQETRIVFNKEDYREADFFVLSLRALNQISIEPGEQIGVLSNRQEVPAENVLATSSRIDFFIDNIQTGQNELKIINNGPFLPLDAIFFYPVENIPWSLDDPGRIHYYHIMGERGNEEDPPPGFSSQPEKIEIVFNVIDTTRPYRLSVFPQPLDAPRSWLYQEKADIRINDRFVAQMNYGFTNEPFRLTIPANVLRPGINSVKLSNFSHSALNFQKITMMEIE